MDSKSTPDMPDLAMLQNRIQLIKTLSTKLAQMSEKFDKKSKEAALYEKLFDGALKDLARATAETKFFAARLEKTRKEKEKLEEKQKDGPLDIVKIIAELKFELDTVYDIFKDYHDGVQKMVPRLMQSIMENKDPKGAVETLKHQLDCASIQATSRFYLENDLPSNNCMKFGEYLEKSLFDPLHKEPIRDPNNPENMEMDT